MKRNNLFLGIVFLVVGVLALLSTLNILVLDWNIILHLWPLLFVFLGIRLLPLKDWLKTVLMLLAIAAGVALYCYELHQGFPESNFFQLF